MTPHTYRLIGLLVGLGLLTLGIAGCGDDDSTTSGDTGIAVVDPFVPEPPADLGAAYMVIKNSGGEDDRLLKAASDVAGAVELHQTTMQNGSMSMARVETMEIPARGEFKLEQGGYHIMLIDLKRALKQGDQVTLTLTFERAGEIKVTAPVVGSTGVEPMSSGTGRASSSAHH